MTPAERVCKAFGSATVVGEALNISADEVWRWNRPIGRSRGRGGLVPDRYQARILAAARERGVDLRPEDLIGSPVEA